MKILFKILPFLILFSLISCGKDKDEDTNKKICTQEYCDAIGEKCNTETGNCEPWCQTNEDCNANQICNEDNLCVDFFAQITDKNLEKCIRRETAINKPQKLSIEFLKTIKRLECPYMDIKDISSLKYFENIEYLSLWENRINDITPLQNLTKLKKLQLGFNEINDISPLINLTDLEVLSISNNNIEDIETLRYLENIKWLNLDNNKIKNIKFLINLKKLKWLTIENNPLTDANSTISALKHNKTDVYDKITGKKYILPDFTVPKNNKGSILKKIVLRPETYIRTTSETSYDRLEEFTLEAPNQADAGSCLYMANTGAAEILSNQTKIKTNPDFTPTHDGETDFSERYLMNADIYAKETIDYTMTDLIKAFNFNKGALLNKDYPFTVGWIKKDSSGRRYPSYEGEEGAYFTAEYNWINDLPDNWRELLVKTPKLGRTLIFLDPELNQNSIWNVGLMNDDIIERIKYELRTKNAPVIIIYNHYLVWHTDIIIGYDDEAGFEEECPMVKDSIKYFREKGRDSYADKIEAKIRKEGGCKRKGIFYVRDSIYDGDSESGKYNYGGGGYEDFYSKKIIYHSYDWVKYLANHVYSIHRIK